jgi:ADP-heptose:LPS heptosyltransferase
MVRMLADHVDGLKPPRGPRATGTRTLLLFPGALGDAVCAQPAMAALATSGPLTLYARGAAAEVARLFPEPPATVSSLDAPEVASLFAPRAVRDDAPAWLSRFDRVVSFTGASDPAVRARLESTGHAVVCPFPRDATGPHASDVFLRGATDAPEARAATPRLAAPSATKGTAVRAVRRSRSPVLVVHPGAGAPAKRCPEAILGAIVARWRRETGGDAIVLLGPVEAGEAGRWSAIATVALPDDVADLAAALALASAYVGCDSGPSHVAAALGVAGVALFVRDEPVAFAPRGPRMSALRVATARDPAEAAWHALRRRLP